MYPVLRITVRLCPDKKSPAFAGLFLWPFHTGWHRTECRIPVAGVHRHVFRLIE
nr:MAG TPA: hypothetical protein [Caudoviricetes sp.]